MLRIYRAFMGTGILLSIILVTSCGDKTTNPKKPDVLIPLAIGNQWEYQATDLDTNGLVLSVDTFLLEIVKDTVIQNMTFSIITANGVRDPEIFWPSNQSDGVWLFILSDSIVALAFKYPASVADRITFGEDSMVVGYTNISVTVPAGTYPCYQYYQLSSGLLEQIWSFSPNLGLVKTEDYARTQGGTEFVDEKMELISYQLH